MNRSVVVVLLGQTAALLGVGLTAFALGLWSLKHDGSIQLFALLAASSTLPGVVLAPLAAVLAERARVRRALMAANAVAVVATVALWMGVRSGLQPGAWTLACLVVSGVGFGVQWPIYTKGLLHLVDVTSPAAARDRDRVAAALQLGPLAQHVAAPACAAALMSAWHVDGVLLLDVALGLAALASCFALPDTATDPNAGGVREAVTFLRERPSLLRLQVFVFVSYCFGAVLQALSTPLLLSVMSEQRAGMVLALTGIGMLAGVVVSAVVVIARPIATLLLLEGVGGVCLVAIGVWPTPWGIFVFASLFLLQMSWSNTLAQRVWQQAVPSSLQVRVFAIRRMIAFAAFPVCFSIVGPVSDVVIELRGDRTAGLAVLFVAAGIGKALTSMIGAWAGVSTTTTASETA